jgi:hypothetical protein
MAFSFNIPRPVDIHSTLKKTAQTVRNSGGNFNGDDESGRFSGSGVEGAYSVGSSEITITITKKPFIALESFVRKKITGYFEE